MHWQGYVHASHNPDNEVSWRRKFQRKSTSVRWRFNFAFFFIYIIFEFLFVEIVLLCGLLIEVFDVDWSKSRRFSSTCIVLGKLLWMVNGKRRRSIFQHLRNWMIVIIQRKCSSSCASISTVKLYAGISFKNGGLRFAYRHYVMWAFAFS